MTKRRQNSRQRISELLPKSFPQGPEPMADYIFKFLLSKMMKFLKEDYQELLSAIDAELEQWSSSEMTMQMIDSKVEKSEYKTLPDFVKDVQLIEDGLVESESKLISRWNDRGQRMGLKTLIKNELDYMTLCPFCYTLFWESDDGDSKVETCPMRHPVAWVRVQNAAGFMWWPARQYQLQDNPDYDYQFKLFFNLGDTQVFADPMEKKESPRFVMFTDEQVIYDDGIIGQWQPEGNGEALAKQSSLVVGEFRGALELANVYYTHYKNVNK